MDYQRETEAVDIKDQYMFYGMDARFPSFRIPGAITKQLEKIIGILEAFEGSAPMILHIYFKSSLQLTEQDGKHLTNFHLSTNIISAKRQFIANKFSIEPISKIAYLLAVTIWVFIDALIIQDKISCLTFKISLKCTILCCCQG